MINFHLIVPYIPFPSWIVGVVVESIFDLLAERHFHKVENQSQLLLHVLNKVLVANQIIAEENRKYVGPQTNVTKG